MRGARLYVPAARTLFLAFSLLTSGYCLLAFVPFTYRQFVEPRLLGWLATFADHHAWFFVGATALLATTFEGFPFRRGVPRRGVPLVFLGAMGAVALALVARPVLSDLGNDGRSLFWALAALVPPAGAGLVDLLVHRGRIEWGAPDAAEDLRLFAAAAGSALLVALSNFALSAGSVEGAADARVVIPIVATHLALFLALYLLLVLLRGIGGLGGRGARNEFALGAILFGALAAVVLGRLVLPALSLSGPPGVGYAAAVGVAVALHHAGLAARVGALDAGGPVRSGFDLLLAPLGPPFRSALSRGLLLGVLALLGWVIFAATEVLDWNHLFRRLGALALWPLALAWMLAVVPRGRPRARALPALVLACVGAVALYRVTDSRAASGDAEGAGLAARLDRYAERDGSYGAVRDWLRPSPPVSAEDESFFAFVQAHTNIPRSIRIAPISVDLVPELAPSGRPRPHVFIVVVDSLRQDYLSPYNPKVEFTPSFAQLARDGVVFRNAFTPYGATGLSEPAIWVGGRLVHQQYVTPFHPMNSLEKLLRAEGYRSIVSLDSILRVLLEPSPTLEDLDRGVPNKDYTLCRSLAAMRTRLDAVRPDGPPIFMYTQPQDIHVSVIQREKGSIPDGELYPGFHPPYAARIRKLDACFGEFLRDLQARGLYDESVIVLTSDHGDSLGEGGRWGHAYTLFPEIVRVPLLVKPPRSSRESFRVDSEAVAFTTDITPTLYSLLGHEPVLRGGVIGRPLFARTPSPTAAPDEGWLLASSYGPVYGLLDRDGSGLYVVDAINYEDWYFDLRRDPKGERNVVTPAIRAASRAGIRRAITSLHEFYRTGEIR